MASPLIKVESVDKVYRIWKHPRARLTGSLAGRLARARSLPAPVRTTAQRYSESVYREFFALKNISFEVNRGETIGIIGKNGSGKSTTLKVIAGTLQPTRGDVSVSGRIAAMLELAAGFEQEFTGRENVYLSAAILGLSKAEIEDKFGEIIDFADIGDFLDQPVKTYSSGMLVRLAFAVHTAVEPEILIIDEALSVGDETFRRKCFARLDRLKEEGTTILFVSHDLGSVVNLTERALFFHEGEIVMEGAPKDVVCGVPAVLPCFPGGESQNRGCPEGRKADPDGRRRGEFPTRKTGTGKRNRPVTGCRPEAPSTILTLPPRAASSIRHTEGKSQAYAFTMRPVSRPTCCSDAGRMCLSIKFPSRQPART
jgi:ABC-type polysaccharide/polyol phosphate transport system ATPase subunit